MRYKENFAKSVTYISLLNLCYCIVEGFLYRTVNHRYYVKTVDTSSLYSGPYEWIRFVSGDRLCDFHQVFHINPHFFHSHMQMELYQCL